MSERSRDARDPADRALVGAARAARENAWAPYSGYPVGAALRTRGGVVYPGCNVENVTLGLTLCAERVAIYAALAEGETDLDALAVVVRDGEAATPCGICRALLDEVAPGIRLLLGDGGDGVRERSVSDLLPPGAGPPESGSRSGERAIDMKDLIGRKRRGETLSATVIGELVAAYTAGRIPDYQMSSLLMAVVWRGMTDAETHALTRAMIDSGRRLSWEGVGVCADKHSTGGVGDKVSLVLAPLAASVGLRVPMLSGRGLGHTGGTLDKLESIPGFRTDLGPARFAEILCDVGCVIAAQGPELCPADGKLYALRDATGTVESVPLIVSSILSKKVAAGPSVLVLDVKVGRGAFMASLEEARTLARKLVATGTDFGLCTLAVLTAMEEPLGRAIGNGLEVREAVQMLAGEEVASDLAEVTLVLTAAMLVGAGRAPDLDGARDVLTRALEGGDPLARFRRMVEAQGGPRAAHAAELLDALPRADRTETVRAAADGYVRSMDARALAEIVLDMGGGRRVVGEAVDPTVGMWLHVKSGDRVAKGDDLLTVHLPAGKRARRNAWVTAAQEAIDVTRAPAPAGRSIVAVIGPRGEREWTGWETALPL